MAERLESHQGPYELSVKENGCIIFISGLEDETLLCSKHSTGVRQDQTLAMPLPENDGSTST
jgi:tRNA ligase